MTLNLRGPETVRTELARKFQRHRRTWLRGGGEWPLVVPLGDPSERDALQQPATVQQWSSAWQAWQGPGELNWISRRYPQLGTQRWPTHLNLPTPTAVAAWIGELRRWQCASERYQAMIGRWPVLADQASRLYDIFADYNTSDFDRLVKLVTWLEANPRSGLFPRQLPIAGLDSKWLEPRQGLIRDLVAGLQGAVGPTGDFHQVCGLRPLPHLVRMRVLDPKLRAKIGDLNYLQAPIDELARLDLPLQTALIVENLQTGLALPDLPGTVALVGLGYSVDTLARLPWLASVRGIYWGDIDTHGMAILSRARGYLSRLESVLMDEATLMRHRDLWVVEPNPCSERNLPHLTDVERVLFEGLQQNRWGAHVRLEQERIDWDLALETLRTAIHPHQGGT